MKTPIFQFILFSLLSLHLSGCVTVDVGGDKAKTARHVKYEKPSAPFGNADKGTGDQTWISQKTGNSISFLSECERSVELNLEQLESDALSVLEKMKIERSEKIRYNGREALRTVAFGKVDGIEVKMQLLTFKKNNCNYSLSYGALVTKYELELSYFDQFINGFQAP